MEKLHHLRMSPRNVFSVFLIIVLFSGYASCKWCTRLKSEQFITTITELGECKQTYHAACGWFSRTQCTFYEIVPCPKERNHTVVQYRIVQECCPGYRMDPVNNITCVLKPAGSGDDSVRYYVSSDDFLFGLSHGAYAGIVCSFLFVLSVTILVTIRVLKRKRANLKAKESKGVEVEMSEKMIQSGKV